MVMIAAATIVFVRGAPNRVAQSSHSAPRIHARQLLRVRRAPQFVQKLELPIVGASGVKHADYISNITEPRAIAGRI
jgi:hypothetical protein